MTASTESAARPTAARRRVPDFFIVGHAKCGTTALYEMLSGHPQIFMPNVKEPQFFARNPPSLAREAKRFEQTGRYPESLDDYLSLFRAAAPEQLVGEASTFYLWSQTAPARIAEAQPDARIIAILREPASFLRSLHLQMVQNRAESERDLRRALALEESRRNGRDIPSGAHWPAALMYSDRVRYVEQLRRYHSVFPREQVLVLIYEDFRRDNEAAVRSVLRFLEVDASAPLELVKANPTVAVRSKRLDNAWRNVRVGQGPLARGTRAATRALTSSAMRRTVLYPLRRRLIYSEPPAPDAELMSELRRRFRSEVAELSEYLDRDLVGLWGYDDVE